MLICVKNVAEHGSSHDALDGGLKSYRHSFLQCNRDGGHGASVGGDAVLISERSKLY